jgi:hypothetical protein
MRAYAQVTPSFWQRGSGAELRGNPAAQALAMYLFSSPLSNMIGLYRASVAVMADDLGWDHGQVRDALRVVESAGIARYDEAQRLVYLPEGGRYQMALKELPLRLGDKRIRSILRELEHVGDHPFSKDFVGRHLPMESWPESYRKGHPVLPEGASGSDGSPYVNVPVPVPVPVPVRESTPAPVVSGGPLSPDEQAVLAELRRYPALASVARPELARAWWCSAVMAKRGLAQIAAAVSWVAADATTKAADGTPRTHEDIRDHIAALVVSWKGSCDDHGQPSGRPSPRGTPWRAPRNVVPIRAGGERP